MLLSVLERYQECFLAMYLILLFISFEFLFRALLYTHVIYF